MPSLELDELLAGLQGCGFEAEVLQSLFRGMQTEATTLTVVPKVIQAVAIQSKRDEESEITRSRPLLEPSVVMWQGGHGRIGWRPLPQVVETLIKHLGVGRVDIAWLREDFVRSHLGQRSANWSQKFMRYALIAHRTKPSSTESAVEDVTDVALADIAQPESDAPPPVFDQAKIDQNLDRLDSAVAEALRGKSVSLIFNHYHNPRWQPPEWLVQELLKLEINGRPMSRAFIYDPTILRSFIGHCQRVGPLFRYFEQEYYFWVRGRFYATYRLRVDELNRLRSKLESAEIDQALPSLRS